MGRRLDHLAVQPIISCDRADSEAVVDIVDARFLLPQGVRSRILVLVSCSVLLEVAAPGS